jgi:hypothetical protein
MLPRIPVNESIDVNLNSCATHSVIQRINPIQKYLGSFNTHDLIVSHGIRKNKTDRLRTCIWTSKLPDTQQEPRSGNLLLRVRAEQPVNRHFHEARSFLKVLLDSVGK